MAKKARNRPDGKILWPYRNIDLGRAIVSMFPTAAEIERGYYSPHIFTYNGCLSVFNPPTVSLLEIRVPESLVLHDYFTERQEYELASYKGPGRNINKIILSAVDGLEGLSMIQDAKARYFGDSDFVSIPLDIQTIYLSTYLSKATGRLVSARQLKPAKYISFTSCEVHRHYIRLTCDEADLYCRYRYNKKIKCRPADHFLKALELLNKY